MGKVTHITLVQVTTQNSTWKQEQINESLLWQCPRRAEHGWGGTSRRCQGQESPQPHSPRRSGSWQRAGHRAPRRALPCWPAARAWPACPCRTGPAWRSPLPGGTCSSHSERAATLGDAERAAEGAAEASACSSTRELLGDTEGWSSASPELPCRGQSRNLSCWRCHRILPIDTVLHWTTLVWCLCVLFSIK